MQFTQRSNNKQEYYILQKENKTVTIRFEINNVTGLKICITNNMIMHETLTTQKYSLSRKVDFKGKQLLQELLSFARCSKLTKSTEISKGELAP